RSARDVAGEERRDLHALPPRASRRGSGRGGHRFALLGDLRRSRKSPARAEGDHVRADEGERAIAPDARTRHNRGLLVVILLGVIFFAILGAIILTPRHPTNQQQTVVETYTVLPLRIRLRTEPNAKAPVVATATSGEKLTMI